MDLFKPDEELVLNQFYLPPPPAPTPKPLTLPSRSLRLSTLRSWMRKRIRRMGGGGKIKLEILEVTFGPEEDSPFKIDFDLKAKLRAVKPKVSNRLIIYERDQVDENR